MSQRTKLKVSEVPKHLRTVDRYAGRTFYAEICERVTLPSDSGVWGGGSRDTYSLVRLADGESVRDPMTHVAPYLGSGRADRDVPMTPGFAVVGHSIFCGKDCGLTFYLHPADAALMLPQSVQS